MQTLKLTQNKVLKKTKQKAEEMRIKELNIK
jgi:hypothetical protein